MLRKFLSSKPLLIGASIVLLVVLAAIFAPFLASHDPNSQSLAQRLMAPGEAGHMLGTDNVGRDIWSRLVYGSRISLQVAFVAVSIGAGVGLLLGLIAGYAGGAVDMLVGRIIDVIMAFPTILLALAIVAALGPSLTNSIIAIGIASTPRFARVIRGVVISIREREFVNAANALGSSDLRIVLWHILPNVLSPLIVLASLSTGTAILVEASLSFLGLGVAPPTPTWGSMITDGKQYMELAPWISLYAGLAIMVSVLGFNLLGDGLRDALDTRL
jgi:peptide/nickel transport system permease protein